jgi:hypothetical protein
MYFECTVRSLIQRRHCQQKQIPIQNLSAGRRGSWRSALLSVGTSCGGEVTGAILTGSFVGDDVAGAVVTGDEVGTVFVGDRAWLGRW